jgi:hypothetical protein
MATAEDYARDNKAMLESMDDASVLAYYRSVIRDPGSGPWGAVFEQQAKVEILRRMEK